MASDRAEQGSLAEALSLQRSSAELLRECHAGKPMPAVVQWLVAGESECGTPPTLSLKRDVRDARPAGAPLACGVRAVLHRLIASA